MLQSKKHHLIPSGDYVSPGDIPNPEEDIEFRCETVSEVVEEKIFSLERALEIYDVSFKHYMGYLMLHDKMKIILDVNVVLGLFNTMLNVIDLDNQQLDSKTEKVIADLREFSLV